MPPRASAKPFSNVNNKQLLTLKDNENITLHIVAQSDRQSLYYNTLGWFIETALLHTHSGHVL